MAEQQHLAQPSQQLPDGLLVAGGRHGRHDLGLGSSQQVQAERVAPVCSPELADVGLHPTISAPDADEINRRRCEACATALSHAHIAHRKAARRARAKAWPLSGSATPRPPPHHPTLSPHYAFDDSPRTLRLIRQSRSLELRAARQV
ncbi:hypothetical protein [Nannocystis pusilla]|uniref:hypothetical protein n=1 Tax=Nannocystis pusilla TaxID=889268 RepID=UPI003B78FA76